MLSSRATFKSMISPLSVGLMSLGFYLSLAIVFRPKLVELLAFLALDIVLTPLYFAVFEGYLYKALYAKTTFFVPKPDFAKIAAFTPDEKLSAVHVLMRFPLWRARFAFFGSFILKGVPAILLCTLYWHHNISMVAQTARVVFVISLFYAYYYAIVFLENHHLATELLQEIHARYDWAETFRQVKLPYSRANFLLQETIGLVTVSALLIGLQAVLVMTYEGPVTTRLLTSMVAVGMIGLALIARCWYVGRKLLLDGLDHIFKLFETFDPRSRTFSLNLSTSPVIANFERTFNVLLERLRENERELAHWVHVQAEQSRFKALGEVSALILHDMANPLQVVHLCARAAVNQRGEPLPEGLAERLERNSYRCVELLESVRSQFRDPENRLGKVPFSEAHQYVVKTLAYQYSGAAFSAVSITVDDAAANTTVKMRRSDLIHVLSNLYGNSLHDLITTQVPDPKVSVRYVKHDETSVVFEISDNGSGLSVEKFEMLTSYAFRPTDNVTDTSGLGLRLVRRLVEQIGGSLTLLERSTQDGTTFELKLPYEATAIEVAAPQDVKDSLLGEFDQ